MKRQDYYILLAIGLVIAIIFTITFLSTNKGITFLELLGIVWLIVAISLAVDEIKELIKK